MAVGRQLRVGDGSPMTAWHDDLTELDAMLDYISLGRLGASVNKLVLVVGPEQSASLFAARLGNALLRE